MRRGATPRRSRAALIAAGAVPAAEAAAEIRRVETGRPRYGVDLDDTVIPQEAGLNERAVSFEKGCYVGQETVARLHFRGKPNRHLRGLRLSAARPSRATPLRLGEREVGRLGTVVASPRLGPIALALVRREAEPGARSRSATTASRAEVVELPFAAGVDLRGDTHREEGHMAAHVLVVATVTATSDDLLAALRERADRRGPVDFTLVMPAAGAGPVGRGPRRGSRRRSRAGARPA